MFNPLEHPEILADPQFMTVASAWVEHIPFAFAAVKLCRPNLFVELGTQAGDSYCAFCQAVAGQKLGTRCAAVDTWRGDVHTGAYSEEVLAPLKAHHDARYGGF